MKEILDEVLRLPRDEQLGEIERQCNSEILLKEFAAVLLPLAEEKKYNPGALKIYSKLSLSILKTSIMQLLKQFPEVPGKKLALDREFPDITDKMNAIIDDLNADRIPKSRFHELLYVSKSF
jgi:hypothetical protein